MIPIVSIIMPALNSSRHIKSAINSVREQNFTDWELIIVDGGSTDNTCQIVMEYAADDIRIMLINNKNDQGPAHARSIGISKSHGEYIAFLDADDLWLKNKLFEQIKFMKNNDTKFSYTQYKLLSSKKNRISCALNIHKKYSFTSALFFRGIATLTVVCKRDLFDEKLLSTYGGWHGEDYLWWLLILQQGIYAKGLMKPLALYRITENSLSKRYLAHQTSIWHLYRFELKLSRILTILVYSCYLSDVMLRRLMCYLCTAFNGGDRHDEISL